MSGFGDKSRCQLTSWFFSGAINNRITASKLAKHLINFSPNLNFLRFYNSIFFLNIIFPIGNYCVFYCRVFICALQIIQLG